MFSLHNVFSGSEGVRMAFSPNESRQIGGGLLVLAFSDDTPLRQDAEFFVSFEGRSQRHLVNAKRVNHVTFHSHIPEHKEIEAVQLSVLMTREGNTKLLASSSFKYIPDPTQTFAEFLLGSIYDPSSLENIDRLKIEFKEAFRDSETILDRKVCKFLSKMTLPETWHMLGVNSRNPDPLPQETLLHLCARLGLRWTALYLLRLPGGHVCRDLPNIQDDTPTDVSNMYGNIDMADIFSGKKHAWHGDPPWADTDSLDKPGPPTRIRRADRDIFVLTSNLNHSPNSLYDDLALMQEVISTRKRPPPPLLDHSQRSRSVADSSDAMQNSSPRSPISGSRSRSKSEGSALHEVPDSDDSEEKEDDTFISHDCHSNHHHGQRHRHFVHTSSQHTGYHGYNHRRQPLQPSQSYSLDQNTYTQPIVMEANFKSVTSSRAESFSETGEGQAGSPGSDWNTPILEQSLRKLQEIHTNLQQKLRESPEYNIKEEKQDDRKENLQRFSTSCPSLPDSVLLPVEITEPANQETDRHKSLSSLPLSSPPLNVQAVVMPDGIVNQLLDQHSHPLNVSQTNSSNISHDLHHSNSMLHQGVTICINDVTIDSSDDFPEQAPSVNQSEDAESAGTLIEAVKKANKRRSSWCPEEGRKKEEKQEKQKMLNVSGRSQSLSSLDGDSDEEEEDDDDVSSASSSYTDLPTDGTTHYSHSPDGTTYNHTPARESRLLRDSMFPSASSTPVNANGSVSPHSGELISPPVMRSLSDIQADSSVGSETAEVVASSQAMSPVNTFTLGTPQSGTPTPQDGNSPSDDPHILMYPSNLSKASSTPSIATSNDNKECQKIEDYGIQMKMTTSNKEDENDNDTHSDWYQSHSQAPLADQTDSATLADEEPKMEKKRKTSVFSKFGSYRQKKVVKETKLLRTTHQFVSVCFGNPTPCDVCAKSMANKPALKCENCMVNVHENSCKDQIATCAKYRHRIGHNGDKKSSSLPESVNLNVNLKGSQSFKERRAISVPARPPIQSSHSSSALQRSSSPSRVINEEREKKDEDQPTQQQPLQQPQQMNLLETTNIVDTLSVSMESLDEGNSEVADIDDDYEVEPEAWSVTVDKKTLRKMSSKDIKRQDHIWELIQTERSHCRTLNIMHKIFSRGMREEVSMSQDMIDRIFPRLSDLLEIHTTFLHRLTERQRLRPDKSIEDVGDLLIQQFDGEIGEQMKLAYGDFCSRHPMAVQLYKDILKSDRKFQNFIKKCSRSTICKRLSIPECILLVTQRVTKYPLLIEPIIKTTKDNKADRDRLTRALSLMRDVLCYIDDQVDAHDKEQRLIEIYNKLDARSYALYKGDKFKKSMVLSNRKLIHEGYMKWMTARGKSFEVLAVILSDVMFFLAENNQKFTFFSQDSKSSVVPLSKLLVREKGDTRDSKGIYLICQSKTEPEMYEFVCRTADERKAWIRIIKTAINRCMEAEGVAVKGRELEGEKKELEAKSHKIRQLMDRLYEKDTMIRQSCDDKMAVIIEMLEVFYKDDISRNVSLLYKEDEGLDAVDQEALNTLRAALQQGSQVLSNLLLGTPVSSLGRSKSNVCDRDPVTIPPPSLPKRAETFSGFDQKEKVKKRYNSGQPVDDDSRSDSQHSLNEVETNNQSSKDITPSNSGNGTKEKVSRRPSTSFLANLLSKGNSDKDTDNDASKMDTPDSTSQDITANLSGLLEAPSREQCEGLAQLMQYLHGLVCIVSQQITDVEKFRAQLSEANSRVSTLYADNKRLSHGFHHEKQLEILREQQEQIRQERSEFERLKAHENAELARSRNEIIELKEEVEKHKTELRQQKEEIQHQREVLQRQMDLFEENKRRVLAGSSESPKGIGQGLNRERSESPVSTRGVSPSSRSMSQSSLLEVSHKRSASDDLSRQGSPDRILEGLGKAKPPLQGTSSGPGPVRRDSGAPLPIHLLSTTNEQKLGQISQQLPMKLGTLSGGKTTPPLPTKPSNPPGVHQMFPLKLLSGSGSNTSSSQAPNKQLTSGSSTTSPSLTHSASLASSLEQRTIQQRTLASAGRTSSGTRITGPGNILPMKLAQKPRPKSASAAHSTSVMATASSGTEDQSHSHKRSSSAVNSKKEEEVIYF